MKVLIDTNVLLHGAPIEQLPFNEIGVSNPELLIHVKVLEELDNKKYEPTQIGKRARKVISKFRELRQTGAVPCNVVALDFVRNAKLAWNEMPDLDPLSNDSHIIAYALMNSSESSPVAVITSDFSLAVLCEQLEVEVFFVDKAPWMHIGEKSEGQLKREQQDKEKAQIFLEVKDAGNGSTIDGPISIETHRILSLTEEQESALRVKVNEQKDHQLSLSQEALVQALGGGRFDRKGFRKAWEDYPEKVIRFYNGLGFRHRRLSPAVNLDVILESTGRQPVLEVIFRIECTSGRFLDDRWQELLSPSFGVAELPAAPKRSDFERSFVHLDYPHPLANLPEFTGSTSLSRRPANPDEWYVGIGLEDGRNQAEELRCASFKHGQTFQPSYVWHPWDMEEDHATIEISVMSDNIPEHKSKKITVKLSYCELEGNIVDRVASSSEMGGCSKSTLEFWESAMTSSPE